MRAVSTLALAALAPLALAACHGLGGGIKAPPRKPGLWEQTMQSDQMPGPVVTHMCLDAATDQKVPLLGRRSKHAKCDKVSVTKAADGSYVSDTVCQTGDGATVTTHTVLTGDFTSHYAVSIDRTTEGSSDPDRDGEFKMSINAVYKGACPPTLLPGQMQRPDGSISEIGQGRGGGGHDHGPGGWGGPPGAGPPGGGPPGGGPPPGGGGGPPP
jgi:hypothetical protein